MAAITPSTNLKLLRIFNDLSDKNQLTFNNATDQFNYFNGHLKLEVDNFTYQRKDYVIRYNACIDDILEYNYCMYQNEAYGDKWFYAYIVNMRYVNDNVTEITIKTDVFQTFQFDAIFQPSFVEREHVSNDAIGMHTVPENLELGEYICEGVENPDIGYSHLVIAATYDCFADKDAGSYVNGIYSGVDYFLIGSVAPSEWDRASDWAAIQYFLWLYADRSKSDAITGMFIVPDKITGYANITWDYMSQSGGLSYYPYKKLNNLNASGQDFGDISISKPYSTIDGYTPHNNKLFTYPYKYIQASNNAGGNSIYQYEYFTSNPFVFKTIGSLTPGCSIKSFPRNYKGVSNNYDEGLSFGKFPICSYNTDMYTNWLTQNGVNIGLDIASGIGQIVAGGAIALGSAGLGTAVGGGSIIGGVSTIANTIAQVYQHSLVPPQAQGNLNNGDINFTMGINKIMFYKMTIKSEFAQIIDKYFDMFGYKVCSVKTPNRFTRTYWNYIKTVDINIGGTIPDFYLIELKNLFNSGITLWHDSTKFLDYTQNNTIVTP